MAREGQGYPCYQHDMMMMILKQKLIMLNKIASVCYAEKKDETTNHIVKECSKLTRKECKTRHN